MFGDNLYKLIASQLRALKQEKRRAERQWLRSKLTVHKHIFNTVKHKIIRLVDKAKTTFYSSKIIASNTCKELFSVTNKLMNKAKCIPLPSSVSIDRLPRMFSDFFCQKVSTIRQTIDSCSNIAHLGVVDKPFCGNPLKLFSDVSEAAVSAFLKKMAPKTCELDPIPTALLFDCSDEVVPALTYVLNESLRSGTFPTVFKQAVVKPLLKKPTLDPNE